MKIGINDEDDAINIHSLELCSKGVDKMIKFYMFMENFLNKTIDFLEKLIDLIDAQRYKFGLRRSDYFIHVERIIKK